MFRADDFTLHFMEPGSSPSTQTEPSPHRLAEVLGTLIALVTLTLPLAVIAHYSTSPIPMNVLQSQGYLLQRTLR
jgi:hypothetical protein